MSITPTTALATIGEGMTWEDRIAARVDNINLCCNTVQQSILFLGAELAACKWSGEYIIDSVWADDDDCRSWDEWLKRRDFKLSAGEQQVKIVAKNAAALMAYASCTASITEVNQSRELPLPLPSSPSQLEPYLGSLARIDDWKPENWPKRATDKSGNFEKLFILDEISL